MHKLCLMLIRLHQIMFVFVYDTPKGSGNKLPLP